MKLLYTVLEATAYGAIAAYLLWYFWLWKW